jgi:hypothetical protein
MTDRTEPRLPAAGLGRDGAGQEDRREVGTA